MDSAIIVRIVAGVLFAVILVAIIMRRKSAA